MEGPPTTATNLQWLGERDAESTLGGADRAIVNIGQLRARDRPRTTTTIASMKIGCRLTDPSETFDLAGVAGQTAKLRPAVPVHSLRLPVDGSAIRTIYLDGSVEHTPAWSPGAGARMMAPMSYSVWISTADMVPDSLPNQDLDPESSPWQEIGFIDTQAESGLMHAIQRKLGIRSGMHVGVKGYVTAFAENPRVRAVVTANPSLTTGFGARGSHEKFWLAINVTAGGTQPCYLLCVQRVQFVDNARRPPEPHPGLSISTFALPIQIQSRDGVVFESRRPDDTIVT